MCDARVLSVLVAVLLAQVACDARESLIVASPDERDGPPHEGDIAPFGEDELADNDDPFTVEASAVPETHDGGKFTFRMDFSDPVAIDTKDMRDHAFNVWGGRITRAQRLNRSRQTVGGKRRWVASAWRITVKPFGPMIVELPVRSCGEKGAVCSLDGRTLSEGLEFIVRGPGIFLTVDDPDAEEGDGEVEFQVTVNGYGNAGDWDLISFDSRTTSEGLDNPATDGEDYVGFEGTISVYPGEEWNGEELCSDLTETGSFSCRVTIPILSDTIAEPAEQFKLALSNAVYHMKTRWGYRMFYRYIPLAFDSVDVSRTAFGVATITDGSGN